MKSIILAGGSGSRLWPLTRNKYPKQLIDFDNQGRSLLQKTFVRLCALTKPADVLVITNLDCYLNIKIQINQIDKSPIVLAEPLSKNTAPAIACALEFFKQKGEQDEVVLIVPSDHLIEDIEAFRQTVERGKVLAERGYIVTFGIKPTYPETGYGYIKPGEKLAVGYKVDSFMEKPNLEAAKQYLANGYCWNGGIFMGKISVFLAEFAKYAPDIFKNLDGLDFSKNASIERSVYENMPSISVDYAIMEKSDRIALVELKSDWNDLGSWQSLYNIKKKDKNGNVLTGKVVTDNVKNSFIYAQKEVVAVSGLENVVIVETEDAIMACKIDESQNVKNLYKQLKEKQSDTVQIHRTVLKPWGYYTCLNQGNGYLTKTICVFPKQKLSVQSHNFRSEHWVVLEGKALVLLDGKEYVLNSGESIDIPLKAKHSLQNPYDQELKIIEIQQGTYISEDDIIRYEDCYGRV